MDNERSDIWLIQVFGPVYDPQSVFFRTVKKMHFKQIESVLQTKNRSQPAKFCSPGLDYSLWSYLPLTAEKVQFWTVHAIAQLVLITSLWTGMTYEMSLKLGHIAQEPIFDLLGMLGLRWAMLPLGYLFHRGGLKLDILPDPVCQHKCI